jgi:hypothetical protein
MISKISLFPVLLLVDFAWATSACATSAGAQAGTQLNRDRRPTNATAGSLNVGCAVAADPDGPGRSDWAFIDDTRTLAYSALPQGDRLLDYSYAGYGSGGVAIPWATTQRTVTPSGGDDTAAIQAAIDAVSQMTPGDDGLRGAVQLAFGAFNLEGSIRIRTSGVVLRGSGSGPDGTLLVVAGNPRALFAIQGSGTWRPAGRRAAIVDDYVPSGAQSFTVDDASDLSVGTAVLVDRPATAPWVHFMGMDRLIRGGQPQTWIRVGTLIHSDRLITAIDGNLVTVDAPISDSFDALYLQPDSATVVPYTFTGRIEQVGLESMSIVAPPVPTPISQPTFSLLQMKSVANGWVRDVVAQDFINGLTIDNTSKWITIEDTAFTHTVPADTSSGSPADYGIDGQQILIHRSSSQGNHWFSVVTQNTEAGPNVVLNFSASGSPTNLAPHQRWATGLLLDNIYSPSGGIALQDRGNAGSGHGWSIGFGVVWNSVAGTLLIQRPPGSTNWSIGSTGRLTQAAEPGSPDRTPLPQGTIDSHGTRVTPGSLYLQQLCERLGPQALANIGY